MMNVCSLILMMVLSQMQSSEAKGFENVLEEHKLRIIAILLYNFTVLFKGGSQMLIFVFSFNYLMLTGTFLKELTVCLVFFAISF